MVTREEWLNKAMHVIAEQIMLPADPDSVKDIDKWRVSVGWPGGRGKKDKAIGQCWSDKASEGGLTEMFIGPNLATTQEVDHVLLHEMVHAAVGVEHGHRKSFGKLARAVGLEGKLTATYAGEKLRQLLDSCLEHLGPFPHARLMMANSGIKKQTTRMLKLECEGCGYTVRTTQKWLDIGIPTCHCGSTFTHN